MAGPAERELDVVVLTPSTTSRRRQTLKMVGLFVLLGSPVAAILAWLLTPALALGYLVAQTAFLAFGLQRRHRPVLRFTADGVAFEAGHFVLRSAWSNVDRIDVADLPSGSVDALVLVDPALHWAADAATRRTVSRRGWDRVVPIGEFEDDWQTGRVGDAIRRWAPELL
jgi:hypothetical protein